jgi:hypothetical protein
MNDQRALARLGKSWGAEAPRAVRGRALGSVADRGHAAGCSRIWLSLSSGRSQAGPSGSIPATGYAMSPTQARQSRLNTIDASQPVITAIMAVTTP